MITISFEHIIIALAVFDFTIMVWLLGEIFMNKHLKSRNNSMKKELERYERKEVARASTKDKESHWS